MLVLVLLTKQRKPTHKMNIYRFFFCYQCITTLIVTTHSLYPHPLHCTHTSPTQHDHPGRGARAWYGQRLHAGPVDAGAAAAEGPQADPHGGYICCLLIYTHIYDVNCALCARSNFEKLS